MRSRPGRDSLVVEAMKMQNEMKAPRAGKVLSHVRQGRRDGGRRRGPGDHRVVRGHRYLILPADHRDHWSSAGAADRRRVNAGAQKTYVFRPAQL